MKYRVTEITGAKASNGQIRTAFRVEGYPNSLSTFHDKALNVGEEIEGNIVKKEKDGKTYHNFYFEGSRMPVQGSTVPQDARLGQIQTKLGSMDFKIDSIIRTLEFMNGKKEATGTYPKREADPNFDERDIDAPF